MKTDLGIIHSFSFQNEKGLMESKLCGCFFCLKTFEPKEVKDWINDANGKTALCPYCGTDSVLGDSSLEINDELLEKMKKRYF